MTAYRFENGGLIDRNAAVEFSWNGKKLQGFKGDTLASAMLANGKHLMGRSFKYHRPRGIFGTGSEEPSALVTVGKGVAQESNLRATMLDLYPGLDAQSQNAWPSPAFDLMGVNQLTAPFFVAGFYYKIFLVSARIWMIPEYFIRRAAGLGRSSGVDETEDYQHHYAFCDVLVVGGGISGISAALAANRSGAKVTLVEERSALGGQDLWREEADPEFLRASIKELEAASNVTILKRTTAFGHYDNNMLACIQLEGLTGSPMQEHKPRARNWHVRAKKVVYATGAIERPLVYANNDRPGNMLAHSGLAYANQFGVGVGQTVVLATNNDDGYAIAQGMAKKGMQVTLCDAREAVADTLSQRVVSAGVDLNLNTSLAGVKGSTHGIKQAELINLGSGETRKMVCDAALSSGGWSPAIHLHCHTGGKAEWRDDIQAFVAGKRLQDALPVGSAAGLFGTQDCVESGWNRGLAAAQNLGKSGKTGQAPDVAEPSTGSPVKALWSVPSGETIKGKAFVDLQNDVSASDVALANQEGYRSVEHLKRYTTLGMATDQGKTSNINGHALLAQAQGRSIPEVGTTTFRPPYTPISLGAFAGPHVMKSFSPYRRTPMHAWHKANGASFVEAGAWLRPEWYSQGDEGMWDSIKREARGVRQRVGMCDVSTLGKIDMQGPDALEFIQRLYCNGFKTLKTGKVRYGLMLREDGYVMDDGTVAKLSDTHFYITTTTANAAAVLAHMEYYLDVVWPDLAVRVSSITDQWAAMSVAGPKSRALLGKAFPVQDLSNEGLPFMGILEAKLGDAPCRILRVSFSGELAYEVHTPAHYGTAVWSNLMEAGADDQVTPYGLEALSALRLEKGHVAGGELDGRTTPADMGLGKMVAKTKDFIGRLGLAREGLKSEARHTLVGLMPADGKSTVIGGSRLTDAGAVGKFGKPVRDLGWVSSAHYSVELEHPIALGFLLDGNKTIGQTLFAASAVEGEHVPVIVISPHMIDPQGVRQNG